MHSVSRLLKFSLGKYASYSSTENCPALPCMLNWQKGCEKKERGKSSLDLTMS